jgi:hypothetical protein
VFAYKVQNGLPYIHYEPLATHSRIQQLDFKPSSYLELKAIMAQMQGKRV